MLEAAHSSLGASVAARWMNCPGSVNLIEHLPDYDPEKSADNTAAAEGRQAHKMAELALESNVAAAQFVGGDYDDRFYTEEMAAHVQTYLDHVNKVRSIPGAIYWIEKKFSLESLRPPRPMYGTADFSAYDPATRTLYVDDLKYGQGVMVEIRDNVQTRYYALGVWLTLDLATQPVEKIVMTIVQPRKEHAEGFIRTETITVDELADFAHRLMEAARATLDPNAPLFAGDHCKFCPAKAVCPELYRKTQEIAASEFDTYAMHSTALAIVKEEATVLRPPAPAMLTNAQIGYILDTLPTLDDWSKAVKEHAFKELRAGRDVPGFKLVERRTERKWIEQQAAAIALEPEVGIDSLYLPTALKSPAQIEKIIGKKAFRRHAAHVAKKSAGVKLVPQDDPRPAITAGSEFELLPEANTDDNEGTVKEEKE